MGWLGKSCEVFEALKLANADADIDGKFLIYNSMPKSFLGLGDELIISDESKYSVNSKMYNLAQLMNSTNTGIKVNVI